MSFRRFFYGLVYFFVFFHTQERAFVSHRQERVLVFICDEWYNQHYDLDFLRLSITMNDFFAQDNPTLFAGSDRKRNGGELYQKREKTGPEYGLSDNRV